MYLEPIKQQLTTLNLVHQNELIGCTPQEILQLEQHFGVKLPAAYQEFLRIMGKGAGQFLRGSDCFYDHLPDLKEAAIALLDENHFSQPLPDDAFVFFMHQGYQFSFFREKEGDDPPTYSYCEGEPEKYFLKTHEKFSEFLATEVELHRKYFMTVAVLKLPALVSC